jgi:serine/threonine protein kinase
MADRTTNDPAADSRVKAALRSYFERQDRGEQVDPEQFLAEHAEIAEELRSCLAADQQLAGLKSGPTPLQEEVSTHSVSERGMETLIPQRVQKADRGISQAALPSQFGRYKVIKPLGSGAMGTVYLAEDSQLERKVALKTPSFEQDGTGELLQRFYREAKTAATLRNPHICPVYDVGQIDGRHYISMAYIKGRPLSAYIQPHRPQSERNILLLIRKMALALQEAHDHGIIHRDLKPGNVMVDEKGEPIIMDFGLARKVQKAGESRLTQSGMIVGSPAYMSPEQVEAESDKLTPAADQYSLGVILYELLTGRLPFRGGITAVIGAILTRAPPPVEELRKDVSLRAAALCARMMHKQAGQRFSSCKAVADEIGAILREEKGTSPPASPMLAPPETAAKLKSAEQPASPAKPAATAGGVAAAASITQSNVTSLYEAAQKCMRKRDYEQVVQMLDSIPGHKRSAEVNALLTKARGLADEVAFLLAEIDEATRLNDNESLARKVDELLKLKPRHHKALQLKEELSRYGKGRIWKPGGYTPDGRRIGEGSWIPWIGVAVGIVAFGLALWAVTIYLKAGDAVVRIQINDPDVEVSFQSRTLNIQSAGQDLKVEPGEDTLKVVFQGAEFETDRFTLNKGENPAIVVELLDKTLSARIGDLSIGEWPVEPLADSTAQVTPQPGETSAGQPVDLLAMLDLTRDSVAGNWTRDAEGLHSDGGHAAARIKMPYVLPNEYDFRIEFTPRGSNDIMQLLSHDGREFALLMGAWGGMWDAFDVIQGRPLDREGKNLVGGRSQIKRGERNTAVVQVRKGSIAAIINDVEIARHTTDYSDLSLLGSWDIGNGSLGLGTTFNQVTFHKAELIPY